MTSIENMSGPEMVAAFNEIASKLGETPVNKFKDKATAIRRLEAIRAKANGSIAEQARLAKQEPDLPEDPVEAKKILQEEFGDPDLPAPTKEKAKGRAKKKAAEPPAEVDVDSASSIVTAFAPRPGTNLERVVDYLVTNLDHYVTASDLISVTYGKKGGALGPLLMVLEGVKAKIASRSLPLELRRERSEPKNPRIGLFVVKQK
jgi:hypothetical protein